LRYDKLIINQQHRQQHIQNKTKMAASLLANTLLPNTSMGVPSILQETKLVVAEYVFIDGFNTVRSKTRIRHIR
jgi:hypothetical protein